MVYAKPTAWTFKFVLNLVLSTQSCFLLNYISVISSIFINKFVQKCQYYYTLSDQNVPLVTVTSVVSLLTIQLCSYEAPTDYENKA